MKLDIKTMNVYVPARDFDESKRFYTELGFELTEAWGGNFDCRLGNSLFRLQNYYVKDWAENFMLQFWVEDAREWYEFVKPVIESGRYKNARISKPETIGDVVITHVVDPSGVLLIFIQWADNTASAFPVRTPHSLRGVVRRCKGIHRLRFQQ